MAQPVAEYSVRVKKNDDGTYTAKCPYDRSGAATVEVLSAPDDSTLRDLVKEFYKGVHASNSKLKYSMQRVWIVRARLPEEDEDEDGLGGMFDLFD